MQKAYNTVTQYAPASLRKNAKKFETTAIPKDAIEQYKAQYLEFRDKQTSREQEFGNPYLPVDDLREDLMLKFSHNELID